MHVSKATEIDIKEAIRIAKDLKEWFNREGLRNIKTDVRMNNLVVARDRRKVYGFLCYTTYSGRMLLLWIGVDRECHRKGVGGKLLKWLEKEASKYNLHYIEVETLPEKYKYKPYEQTRAFYYKNGFIKAAYRKARVKGWADQIILEKKIR